jgi:hypothetical protein
MGFSTIVEEYGVCATLGCAVGGGARTPSTARFKRTRVGSPTAASVCSTIPGFAFSTSRTLRAYFIVRLLGFCEACRHLGSIINERGLIARFQELSGRRCLSECRGRSLYQVRKLLRLLR